MTRLVLASASPARLATLTSAGIDPVIRVSRVDEDRVLADATARFGELDPADAVLLLAQAKADDVASQLENPAEDSEAAVDISDVIVLGADSMLELDGQIFGKPADAEEARDRWQAMRGTSGILHTGHWLIDLRPGEHGGSGGTLGATSSTTVHFADVSDAEIDAYIASGEPLHVAGAFTIDGLGGPFISGIEGDHHGVVGLSLGLFRELLAQIEVPITDLWRAPSPR